MAVCSGFRALVVPSVLDWYRLQKHAWHDGRGFLPASMPRGPDLVKRLREMEQSTQIKSSCDEQSWPLGCSTNPPGLLDTKNESCRVSGTVDRAGVDTDNVPVGK